MAVSGTGVALATAGGVLLYAGLKGESPLVALRDIVSGHPDSVSASSDYQATATGSAVGSVAGGAGDAVQGVLTPGFPELVTAVEQFRGDRYSQSKRWQTGFSDCSSFVGKGFMSLGVKPPGSSVTGSYLTWSALTKVAPSEAQAGDLLVNAVHMAVVTGPNAAIGQENPSRNVATGTFAAIMSGTGSYLVLRYNGTGALAQPPAVSSLRTTG